MIKRPGRFWVILFGVCFGLASTAQTPTHRDALVYYSLIASQVKDLVPKTRLIWGHVQSNLHAAAESNPFRPNRSEIQMIKTAYEQNVRDLEKGIRSVSALAETDPEIDLKQVVVRYLTGIKQAEESALPKIILLLETGVNKINDQQTAMLKGFLHKGRELQSDLQRIEVLMATYQQKYAITPEEQKNVLW